MSPRRPAPRPASLAVGAFAERLAPATVLAEVQRVWPEVAGPVIAAEATPTAERAGTLTITCRSAVWAQELDLMGPDLVGRLNAALGREVVTGLRCSAAPPRGWVSEG